jgi:hypothetical protein
MRSRAARLTFGAAAWLSLAAGGYLLLQSDRRTSAARATLGAFDQDAREATAALADLRAAQQAYVAAGQSAAFWVPKVAATLTRVTETVTALGQTAASTRTRAALDEAAASVAEFAKVDRRTRGYLESGESLMAGDIVFSEGRDAAARAARHIEAARLAEHEAFDAAAAAGRRREALAAAGVAAFSALIVAVLVPRPRATIAADITTPTTASPGGDEFSLRLITPAAAVEHSSSTRSRESEPTAVSARGVSPVLTAAASLCTDFGRFNSLDDLSTLLGRVADLMDASGLVLWLGDATGGDLRPIVAHGYGAQALARMPTVPKSADNAAAAAYRTAALQIVRSGPGTTGAIVAPLLAAEGCVGALSAEIRGGGESSESVQALATIFAAQVAGALTTAPTAPARRATGSTGH